jgi:hypothetical protein
MRSTLVPVHLYKYLRIVPDPSTHYSRIVSLVTAPKATKRLGGGHITCQALRYVYIYTNPPPRSRVSTLLALSTTPLQNKN